MGPVFPHLRIMPLKNLVLAGGREAGALLITKPVFRFIRRCYFCRIMIGVKAIARERS